MQAPGIENPAVGGQQEGEGLMRRLDVSPDPIIMLDAALQEAARAAAIELTLEDGASFAGL